jgi:hypothetical protein
VSENAIDETNEDTSPTHKEEDMKVQDKYFHDVIHDKENYFRVPFQALKMRARQDRMTKISKIIVGACLSSRGEYRYNSSPTNYFNTNKQQLAVDCINLIDGVKDLILLKLGVDTKDMEEEATLPVQDDRDGLIQALDDKNELHKIALTLLEGHSESSYNRLRLNLKAYAKMPTYRAMTKERPEIEAGDIETTINNTSPSFEIDSEVQNTVPVALDHMSEEGEIQRALREASDNGKKYMSKIKGGYQEYLNLLEEKHKKKGRLIKKGDQVFVIDSIDGAQHIQSNKKLASVISYSTLICNPVWLNERHVTVGSSLNILT